MIDNDDSSIFPEKQIRYATFWERFGALFLDAVILWVAFSFLGHLAVQEYDEVFFGIRLSFRGSLLEIAVAWLYFVLQESSAAQATLGKRAFGIKVTGMQGTRVSFLQATGRYFGRFISYIILFIGYFMMLWDRQNQTLHDKMAATLVVKG
jgi:uncharacterized RDD family membrane protein YckC